MSALAAGLIAPQTAAQEHFVQVCSGKVEPITPAERTWMLYKQYCDYEKAEEGGRRERDADLRRERNRWEAFLENAGPDLDCTSELQAFRNIENDLKTISEIRNRFVVTCDSEEFAAGELAQDPKALLKALADDYSKRGHPSKYCRGAIVQHERLGRGEVIDVDSRGGPMLIRVRFEREGLERWLVAEYASMNVL
jgi:hypothetical protein